MTDNMKIDITSIESKLNNSSIIEFKPVVIGAIEKFIEVIRRFEASGKEREIYTLKDNYAEESINSYANMLSEKIGNNDAIQVLDSLRHTFSCYAFNGLHQLYTRQENECWHPKIILTEVLTPNDISSLEQNIKLYRGCDVSEYIKGIYGQAWTTSLQVAEDFAYKHYQWQEWFSAERRVVLETTYSRDNVLFSDQTIEFEVVVDVYKLECISKHT